MPNKPKQYWSWWAGCKGAESSNLIPLGWSVKQPSAELTASFRGYPLSGAKVELFEGYKGFIFNDSKDPKPSSYSCVGKFKNFTYWNWDKPPSKNDPVIATMDWLTLSGAIHDPIDIEDV